MTNSKEAALIELLWDYLADSSTHKEMKKTGFGDKTQAGLIASIEMIMDETKPREKIAREAKD